MDAWLGTLFVIIMAVVSRFFYLDNKYSKKRHELSQPIQSQPTFKLVYFYIMAVTVVVSPLCFFLEHPYLLEWHHSKEVFYSGLSLASIGMGLFIMSKLKLGQNYNPCFEAYLPKDLIQAGLYKYIRHPIYTANITTMAGATLATGSYWLVGNLILLCAYYYRASLLEERALLEAFPDYQTYKEHTGAFLPNLGELYKNGILASEVESYLLTNQAQNSDYLFEYQNNLVENDLQKKSENSQDSNW